MGNIFSTCQDDTPGKPLDLSPPPPPEFAQKSLAQRSTASRALMSDLETNAANAQEAPNAAVPDAIAVDGTSPAWLSSVLGLEVESASAESMAAAGGCVSLLFAWNLDCLVMALIKIVFTPCCHQSHHLFFYTS